MRKFVFLIHPRLSAREDMGRVNPIFKFIPEPILRSIIKHLPPIASSRIVIGGNEQVEGMIIVVPLVGSQFYSLPRDFVIEKIKSAVKMARDLDASVVGLGEFTSSVSHGGLDLEREAGITITNGNSLTAGVTVASVEKIIIEKKFTPENLKIGVVGAAGSIGSAVSRMLADQGLEILANDKNCERLKKTIAGILLDNPRARIKEIADMAGMAEADIVVVASSASESVIKSEYLKRGAVVYDITQPRNVSPQLLISRPDVTVIDGGIIDTPRIDYGMDIGLRPNQAFACLAETIIFALEGNKENSVGFVNPAKAAEMLELMRKYEYFDINFYSYGKPVTISAK